MSEMSVSGGVQLDTKPSLPEKDEPSHWGLRQGKSKEEMGFVY